MTPLLGPRERLTPGRKAGVPCEHFGNPFMPASCVLSRQLNLRTNSNL